MCCFISDLASNSGERMDFIPFMMPWCAEMGKFDHTYFCVLAAFLRKLYKSFSPESKFFPPLHLLLQLNSPFPSWFRSLLSPGDAQWNIKKAVLWLDERYCTWAQDFHCVPWKRWLWSCKDVCVSPQAGIGTNIEAAASFCSRKYN